MSLAPSSAGYGDVFSLREKRKSSIEPAGDKFAIAVDELHKSNLRVQFHECRKAFVPRPCCSERLRHIKTNDGNTQLLGRCDAIIVRSGIYINYDGRSHFY